MKTDPLIYNKQPPQARYVEESVLGAILIEGEAYDRVSEFLKPEVFYVTANQVVYKAIGSLKRKLQPTDMVSVSNELEAMGELEKVGGLHYLSTLVSKVVNTGNLENHALLVCQKYTRREIIRMCGDLINKTYDETIDLDEIIATIETELVPISQQNTQTGAVEIKTALVDAMREIETNRHREYYLTGVSTGYSQLNKLTCGWQNTDLIIIAARPSCGKTAFMLNLALNAAKDGNPVIIFSLEMSAVQLVKRLLSIESDLYLQKIRDARLTDFEIKQLFEKGVQPLANYGIFIDDKASLNVFEFRSRLKKYIKKYGVKIAFGDYLQLMKGSGKKGQNREQEISEISRELKITAKECFLPIVELSQLSREVEKRSNNEPQMSDLRESGAIEQDADIVGFLYNPHSKEELKQDVSLENDIVLKIAKNRNGALERISFEFNKPVQRFVELGTYTSSQNTNKPFFQDDFPGRRNVNNNNFYESNRDDL